MLSSHCCNGSPGGLGTPCRKGGISASSRIRHPGGHAGAVVHIVILWSQSESQIDAVVIKRHWEPGSHAS